MAKVIRRTKAESDRAKQKAVESDTRRSRSIIVYAWLIPHGEGWRIHPKLMTKRQGARVPGAKCVETSAMVTSTERKQYGKR